MKTACVATASAATLGLIWFLWVDYVYTKYDNETEALIHWRPSMPKMPPA